MDACHSYPDGMLGDLIIVILALLLSLGISTVLIVQSSVGIVMIACLVFLIWGISVMSMIFMVSMRMIVGMLF